MNLNETHSESEAGADKLAVAASTSQPLNESTRCQDELEEIFRPSIPYILEPGQIFFGKEHIFDRQEKCKKKKEIKPGDHMEVNIKSDQDPKMIKMRKSNVKKRRKNLINHVRKIRQNVKSQDKVKRAFHKSKRPGTF
jgi:hypothetical protein